MKKFCAMLSKLAWRAVISAGERSMWVSVYGFHPRYDNLLRRDAALRQEVIEDIRPGRMTDVRPLYSP